MFSEATWQFITQHRFDDPKRLALQCRGLYPDVDLTSALQQIAHRQAIKDKIPTWYATEGLVYPDRLSIEQCSSEATALYKSALLAGKSFVDLTGGFGVDCAFIATKFQKAFYVEQQPQRCAVAEHNFPILNLPQLTVVHADAQCYLQQMNPVDCIYLDPARRGRDGRKKFAISDCEPDIIPLIGLLLQRAECVLIKLSPMLDVDSALQVLPNTSEVHVVSVENECKELLFLLRRDLTAEPTIRCVNLSKGQKLMAFAFTRSEEKNAAVEYASEILKFLYEPNASLMKAGAYKLLVGRFCLRKLHPNSHLYTSSRHLPDFPGRCFEVKAVSSFNKATMQQCTQHLRQANLSVRNFPATVDELKKRLKLRDGGNDHLFATTLFPHNHVLILTEQRFRI